MAAMTEGRKRTEEEAIGSGGSGEPGGLRGRSIGN